MIRQVGTSAVLLLAVWCSICRAAEPPVTAMTFTPQGDALVCGSQAGLSLRLVVEPTEVKSIETTLEQIHDVRFSPRGDRLAVAGGVPAEEGVLEVLAWPSRERLLRLTIGDDLLYGLIWLDDGASVAVAGFDGTASLIDVENESVVVTLTGHSRGVTSIAHLGATETSAADFQLVTASIDQTLRLWRPSTGETVRTLHNHTAPVHALALRPANDGLPVIASISDDRTVRFWQPTIGRMMRFVRLESVPLTLAWTNQGQHVLVGCSDGHLRTIDPETAVLLDDRPVLNTRITSLAVNPTTEAIAVGGPNGKIQLQPLTWHPTRSDAK